MATTASALFLSSLFQNIGRQLNNRYETFGTFAVNGLAPGQPVERSLTPAQPINFLTGLQYAFQEGRTKPPGNQIRLDKSARRR